MRMLASSSSPPVHAFSVDVEDWYHDGGWLAADSVGARVEANTMRLLELLGERGARATFFFVGDVAERHPALVRRVAAAGHEVGSHGFAHRHLRDLLWREFRDDAARSLAVLQDLLGAPVRGFRAPYFALRAGVRWPLEVLAELGVGYDSSILPIDRPPGLELVCPRTPYRHHNGLWEVPVGILQLLHFWHLPLASGAGLRMLPPRLMAQALGRFEREVGSAVFYLHPWEIDPESPTAPGLGRWLLRVGRGRLIDRLDELLRSRRFVPICEAFPQIG
jgi:polysaccharide deacetylase family protein (PEP-CTERM system associated)